MTQNQKFLKLGTGTPTDKVRRRMEKRGAQRSAHASAKVGGSQTAQRSIERASTSGRVVITQLKEDLALCWSRTLISVRKLASKGFNKFGCHRLWHLFFSY